MLNVGRQLCLKPMFSFVGEAPLRTVLLRGPRCLDARGCHARSDARLRLGPLPWSTPTCHFAFAFSTVNPPPLPTAAAAGSEREVLRVYFVFEIKTRFLLLNCSRLHSDRFRRQSVGPVIGTLDIGGFHVICRFSQLSTGFLLFWRSSSYGLYKSLMAIYSQAKKRKWSSFPHQSGQRDVGRRRRRGFPA